MADGLNGIKSTKVNVTLSEGVYEVLSELALSQGRTVANFASFVLEYYLTFVAPGVYPLGDRFSRGRFSVDISSRLEMILEKAVSGQKLTDCELALLAEKFDLDQRKLVLMRDSQENREVEYVG